MGLPNREVISSWIMGYVLARTFAVPLSIEQAKEHATMVMRTVHGRNNVLDPGAQELFSKVVEMFTPDEVEKMFIDQAAHGIEPSLL